MCGRVFLLICVQREKKGCSRVSYARGERREGERQWGAGWCHTQQDKEGREIEKEKV